MAAFLLDDVFGQIEREPRRKLLRIWVVSLPL
jgi:hypothetical protein